MSENVKLRDFPRTCSNTGISGPSCLALTFKTSSVCLCASILLPLAETPTRWSMECRFGEEPPSCSGLSGIAGREVTRSWPRPVSTCVRLLRPVRRACCVRCGGLAVDPDAALRGDGHADWVKFGKWDPYAAPRGSEWGIRGCQKERQRYGKCFVLKGESAFVS